MQRNNKKKICIVVSSLGAGGAERSAALLSIMLDNLGYEIHIVTVLNIISYEYAGTLFNLGALKDDNDSVFGRLSRLRHFRKYIKTHQFDCIIDHRSRVQWYRELIITKAVYRSTKTIYVIHNFNTSKAFTGIDFLNRWLYKNKTMVAVSEEARAKFTKQFGLKKSITIHNAFDIEKLNNKADALSKEAINLGQYIIFFGRLDDQHKNLKLLIEAYAMSELASHNISLLILGDGPDSHVLKAYIDQHRMANHVLIKAFTNNPYPYVKHAIYTILTSRYEGFPMVLPESLAVGTPVVSVNCSSGPKEIIIPTENGCLVENNDPKILAEVMHTFIFDEHLYQRCKNNARESVQKFSIENITKDWQKLLADL